jgi:hypothetical protein
LIREHMEVVGSDGNHVGTVDELEAGNTIKLTKNDPAAQGQHHWIPLDWVASVDDRIHLHRSSQEAVVTWLLSGPESDDEIRERISDV